MHPAAMPVRTPRILFPVLLVLSVAPACTESSEPSETEDVRRIEAISAQRAKAFNAEDAKAIARHFAPDAVLMPPGQPADTGRAAVESYYRDIFEAYEVSLSSRYEEVRVEGDLAYGRGIATVTLTPEDGGETTTSTSKYLNILERRADSGWTTTHDIWNANAGPSSD